MGTNLSARRGMIALGAICLLLFVAVILFYDSPVGWEQYFPMGLVAGAGWLTGGLRFRQRHTLIALHLVCAVALIVGLTPFILMLTFRFDAHHGDLFAMVHRQVADERLTYRVRANAWGHDANGFRNAHVPTDAAIIAIGDSQTWGFNARRDQAWPAVLADLTGEQVYSMALGGYGPVEYWVLMADALEQFDPQIVVVAVYLGNDLYDAAQSIYLRDTFAQFRDPQVADRPPAAYDRRTDGRYAGGRISTEFTAAYRLVALDLDRAYVAEGLRLTKVMLSLIKQQAHAADVRLVVLLIPTQETAYASLAATPQYPDYVRLVEMEARVRADLITFLDAEQIEYVDSLPALTAALHDDQPVFYAFADGHLIAPGYAILASLLYQHLYASPRNP